MSIADAKSASFLRVPSLTKIQARNFSLLGFPKCLYLINGQFDITSLSLRYSKMISFFHFFCHRSFPRKGFRDSGRSKGTNFKTCYKTRYCYCWSYFITAVTFSVLVYQMGVLYAKQLDFAYSFSFGETSYKHLKVTSVAWRPWDVLRLSV